MCGESAGCAHSGATNRWLRCNTTRTALHGARTQPPSHEMNYTAKFWKTPPPQRFFQLYDHEDAEREVRPAALLEPRPHGTLRSTSSTSYPTCRFSMCLCRRWVDSGGGGSAEDRQAVCRAGYRRAQDLSGPNPTAFCGASSAEGWTVGESAHDRVLLFSTAAACRADHRQFQFRVVEVVVDWEVFKVFPQDRIQQHGLWSRTLTFQFPEVACMFSLILVVPAHPQFAVMSVGKVFFFFFGLFPGSRKVRSPPRVRGCPPGRARGRWRLVPDEYDEYFEYNGALWEQAWDYEHQCWCWYEVDADDGSCFLPVYPAALGVTPVVSVNWSCPVAWSWPCDSSCTWSRPGASSWPCGRCTGWRASSCPPTVTSL